MVVNITLTPLYGVYTDHKALSYLLSIDNFKILLDCGWNSSFDPAYLENLAKVAPSIDVVLLSHPDVPHLGALPYAIANLGLTATVYSTLPIWRMGRMFMTDAYLSMDQQSPFEVFTSEHIQTTFDIASRNNHPAKYILLKYQQGFPLDAFPGGMGIVITPHNASNMLGGTVWDISKETEKVVYAVNFNHRRERHLNPTTLAAFSRPSHLIVGAARSLTPTELKKPSELHNKMKSLLKDFGNVLIPVDTAGRVIELSVQLHDIWSKDEELSNIPLVIMHNVASRTIDLARSMIEWMSDEVVRRFDVSRENLFVFKHIRLCQTMEELEDIPSPMVVMATSLSLETGYSRRLFAKWASEPRNAVLLVHRPEPNTLYAKLYEQWRSTTSENSKEKEAIKVEPLSISMNLKWKEYLKGEELSAWREQERTRKAQEEEEARQQEELLRKEEEEELELQRALEASKAIAKQEAVVLEEKAQSTDQVNRDNLYDDPALYDAALLDALNRIQMNRIHNFLRKPPIMEVFPFTEPPMSKWDDYGQIVDTTRFMIGEDPGEGAPIENSEAGDPDDNPDAGADAKEIIPTKYVEKEFKGLMVKCQIQRFDNAGLSDGDSLKRLIKEVEPRHVTLVAGTGIETTHLKQFLLRNLYSATNKVAGKTEKGVATEVDSVVSSPTVMETVDITSNSSVFELMLNDSLVSKLDWNRVGRSEIAFADGIITSDQTIKGKLILAKHCDDSDQEADLMDIDTLHDENGIALAKRGGSVQTWGHPTVFVGTIMLNQLKDVMVKAGLKAEIAGGALCVENHETGAVVLVKKVGAQQIIIEGAFSEEYLTVKDLLYDELVIPQ